PYGVAVGIKSAIRPFNSGHIQIHRWSHSVGVQHKRITVEGHFSRKFVDCAFLNLEKTSNRTGSSFTRKSYLKLIARGMPRIYNVNRNPKISIVTGTPILIFERSRYVSIDVEALCPTGTRINLYISSAHNRTG